MKVKVYAPLYGNTDILDETGYLELKENATLKEVFKKLKIPLFLRTSLLCTVNYERVKTSIRLSEGDIVSFIGPLSGG